MSAEILSKAQDRNLTQSDWIARGKSVLMNTYASHPIVLESGNGTVVKDVSGKEYLDFISGIAVNALGHTNEILVNALSEQASQLGHCSNLFLNKPAISLAEKLLEESAFQRVFFCNSGTEAIEAAFKLARKYAKREKGEQCTTILTMSNSFHGRSYGALSLTAQTKYQNGYAPLVPAVQTVRFNDISDLKNVDSAAVAAIILEPIQGEGGIHSADREFLRELRSYCNDKNIVLIFDEIQCGMGRTGTFFAHEQFGVAPDIVALAKGLGGGFPVGATLATEPVASAFGNGDHGSTFGGNPLACAVAFACVNEIKQPVFLDAVKRKAAQMRDRLSKMQAELPIIKEIRGEGLLIGVELTMPVKPTIGACVESGLLLVGAGETVIRMLPPLNVTDKQIDQALNIFETVLQQQSAS